MHGLIAVFMPKMTVNMGQALQGGKKQIYISRNY